MVGLSVKPVVSVIMPTRGRPDFVSRAVKTVLDQSFSDLELLILDNSPQTDRDKIRQMSESDSRIRFVDRGNIGVTEARKLGALLSHGDLLALLDSDDFWSRDRLERHLEVWKHTDIGLSWDRWAETNPQYTRAFPQPFSPGLIPAPRVSIRLYKWNFIHASAGIVSADFARSHGFPLLDIMSSDWTLFMRAAENRSSFFLGETLSFKETASPGRVTDVVGRDFFERESQIVKRWFALHRPAIYGKAYAKRSVARLLGRYKSRR